MDRRSFTLALLAALALAACRSDLHRPKKDNQATEPENSATTS
jgi:hypothetical protein